MNTGNIKMRGGGLTRASIADQITTQISDEVTLSTYAVTWSPLENSDTGGTWAWVADSEQYNAGYYRNTSAELSDYIEFENYVEAGTYSMSVIYRSDSGGETVSLYVNDTDTELDLDCNSESVIKNLQTVLGTFTVSESGLTSFKFITGRGMLYLSQLTLRKLS